MFPRYGVILPVPNTIEVKEKTHLDFIEYCKSPPIKIGRNRKYRLLTNGLNNIFNKCRKSAWSKGNFLQKNLAVNWTICQMLAWTEKVQQTVVNIVSEGILPI